MKKARRRQAHAEPFRGLTKMKEYTKVFRSSKLVAALNSVIYGKNFVDIDRTATHGSDRHSDVEGLDYGGISAP